MKVLDEKGRFQFIKNQQVVIDKKLKKYIQLELLKGLKNEVVANEAETTYDNGNIINNIVSDSPYVINTIPQRLQLNYKDIDENLRMLIGGMTKNEIITFLKSKNAKEFNAKFSNILMGEVDTNKYNLQVVHSNWDYEMELPVGNPKKEKKKTGLNIFIKNIRDAIKKTKEENTKPSDNENEISVVDFFSTIHIMGGKEQEFIDRIGGYFELYNNAAIMNQTAQMDEICQRIIIDVYESVLFVNGCNKFIRFGELEKLKVNGAKLVDIDYVSNFGRVIPSDIVKKKIECDDMCVFDNYCIMYYDTSGNTFKKESKAKRDPILFGLINHSDKLYYIADWVDELCDLTLEKIAEKCSIETIE